MDGRGRVLSKRMDGWILLLVSVSFFVSFFVTFFVSFFYSKLNNLFTIFRLSEVPRKFGGHLKI